MMDRYGVKRLTFLAVFASFTVKMRIRIWGSPMNPSSAVNPRESHRYRFGQPATRRDQVPAPRMNLDCAVKHGIQVKPVMLQHQQGNEGAAEHQQERLDNLYPGGGKHAAEGHVGDHQHADPAHGPDVIQSEQQLDQFPRAHKLRDEIKDHRGQGPQRGNHRDRPLVETEGNDVDKRITAEVAQPLGDQEQDNRPTGDRADSQHQPVGAGKKQQACQPQETSQQT